MPFDPFCARHVGVAYTPPISRGRKRSQHRYHEGPPCERTSLHRLFLTPHPLARTDNHARRRSPLPQPRGRAHARRVDVQHREDDLPPQLVHSPSNTLHHPSPPQPPPPPPPPPSIVTACALCFRYANPYHTPIYVAKEQGWLKEEGQPNALLTLALALQPSPASQPLSPSPPSSEPSP